MSHLSLMISCSNPPPDTRTHTHTHRANPQVNDTDMKDICFPLIPSEIISCCLRPDSSSLRQHVSTGPQFHQMYALQLQPRCHLSPCVCVSAFWHRTYLFLATLGIRKQGHHYSGVQTITASTHPYFHLSIHPSNLSTHPAFHLCPLWLLADTLITFRDPRQRSSCRE